MAVLETGEAAGNTARVNVGADAIAEAVDEMGRGRVTGAGIIERRQHLDRQSLAVKPR